MLFPAARHEVSFWHGDDRLVGDLRLPSTPGPHPVLVVVADPHRPAPGDAAWLDALADAGFASFVRTRDAGPERAGVSRRVVAHRAREVLAVVERLRSVPDLDPDAVGVVGWGEGGWAAAQATTFGDHLSALVLACTPSLPDAPGYDPRPTLSALTVPVLALFGEEDVLVPYRPAAESLRAALAGARHPDHQVGVVRGADHALRVRPRHGLGGTTGGLHRFGDWPAGLTALLVEWLDARLRPGPVPAFAPPLHAPAVRPSGRSRTAPPLPVPVRQVRRRVVR